MNVVNINGRTYSAPDGVSVSVINNKVYFNGKLQEDFNNWKEKNIEIIVCGDCKEVKADAGNINIKGNVEAEPIVDWLKALKGRVQPKKEWSEDDEDNLTDIFVAIDNFHTTNHKKELITFLKSLKDRYTWKPSDEQIKVCKKVYADILSAKGFDIGTVNSELNRLEEELKKLTE